MCDVCRQYPCPPMCPNVDPPPVVGVCSVCGENIYGGEYFYRIGEEDETIHSDCIQGFTLEELMELTGVKPSDTFRNADLDGKQLFAVFGIFEDVVY